MEREVRIGGLMRVPARERQGLIWVYTRERYDAAFWRKVKRIPAVMTQRLKSQKHEQSGAKMR